ncbi:hypothetical protein I302_105885 [Kwoniella bestiolae CBS 10118]|uniref:tRNA-dihydrouridine synthase 4 n=1 Tax=Kwoniella bestiolae CBS 10118 TaxID=1296100 RepID=A0A1B9G2E6_9TREE|nr:tRNA-dihydrouridine synthase 4 [Kwoniella bestiolae CBS 10118]OCF25197.1 tRNA-dihydrouridine synthase 4 [Kwoniella bestiolae CBS 10118]
MSIHRDPDADDIQLYSDLPPPIHLPTSELLEHYNPNVLAPLVRCSKLPFRHLTSLYETHITHTPMILAEEFSRAQVARVSDFSTSSSERGVYWMTPSTSSSSSPKKRGKEAIRVNHPDDDRPETPNELITYYNPPSTHSDRLPPTPTPPTRDAVLVRGNVIAQFASPNAKSLVDAAELISPYVDGIDLNCGCPQRWAYNEGIGCALLRKPELVRDMVRAVKQRMGWGWSVSIKIRIDPDQRQTETLIRNALASGISYLSIHGRTRHQPSTDPVNLDGIKFAVETVKGEVPCTGNGDIWTYEDVLTMRERTGVKGVMAARGLLANPALFANYSSTPPHAISQFISLSTTYGLIFPLFHRHLAYMLESDFSRNEKVWFNCLSSSTAAIDWLEGRGLDWRSARGSIWDARRGRGVVSAL